MRWLLVLAYVLTIPAANWMVANVGECSVGGPCTIPVGFGLHAPSGVAMVGFALLMRDVIQGKLGRPVTLVAIGFGTLLAALVAPTPLVLASAAAFLFSEIADMAVYTPLRRRRLLLAVLASGLVGAIIDSAIFLLLAFGSLDFVYGQILGKVWVSFAAVPAILALRRRVA